MIVYQAMWPDGYTVRWRNLTWAEYRRIEPRYLEASSRFSFPMDVYLEVYDLVRIDSSTHRIDPPAGVIAYVASQQLKTNPFNGTEADIKGQLYSSRSKIDSSYLETARCMVAAAFKYRFEDMDDWDPVVFFDMVARAEKVLGRLAEPVSPNANKPLEVPESVKQEAMNRSRRKRRA